MNFEDKVILVLMQNDCGGWIDVTASHDTAANTIYGMTTSLGTYAIAIPDHVCGDANGNETVNLLDITYLIAYLYLGGPEPGCP